MRRRCRASRSASSAAHVSREASKLLPTCLYRPFSNCLRLGDYTRGAAANQLDDGIGDTFVLGSWYELRPSLFPNRDSTLIGGRPVCNGASAAGAESEPTLRGTASARPPGL